MEVSNLLQYIFQVGHNGNVKVSDLLDSFMSDMLDGMEVIDLFHFFQARHFGQR
jgi:hypothetical protein